jgi:8-oxo-dGTP pyrophosphatase MutT (NUDIX family)
MRSAVYLLLLQQEQILLARRCNTGYQDGNYSLVAGHVEEGERVTEALFREVQEEAGITLAPQDLEFVHLMHRHSEDELIYFDFFFVAHRWTGEVTNCEPHKCDDLRWFPLAALPANTVAYVREVLAHVRVGGSKFSEYGWDNRAATPTRR